jgi:hypothetical protein
MARAFAKAHVRAAITIPAIERAETLMPTTKSDPGVIIVLTGPDGEAEEIHIPRLPPMPLWRRFTWRIQCWRTDVRNAVYWLRGGHQ